MSDSEKNAESIKNAEKSVKKEGFFHKAFREMGESARVQHEVDKANFAAAKAESKANFEENRGANTWIRAKENSKKFWDDAHLDHDARKEKEQEARDAQIADANARKKSAEKRIEAAKQIRENAKRKR